MAQQGQDVKSTAVVKFAAVDMPARFQQLQQNTDLKQPPSNWLHANSKWESYVRNLSFGKGQTFSSFKMGHCYPDLTGEIDVVSDAENIKKMLKIPYSKGHVSMMVHRVGNTLLLDDFDIHKHLLRQQEKDWKWLRTFYYETIVQNMQEKIKDQMHMIKKNKSRDHLQNRNMFSKFLYYSIGKSEETETDASDKTYAHSSNRDTLRTSAPPLVPDAFQQAENETRPEHLRTQVWTFENIQMLVGTDLPIFGGGTHPCISLRLRNMTQPINVLTGIDYWLDNLICNVPELAMCYHLDGIVKDYKLFKTEDIPKMPKSEFSPGVIRDVAQNILSFLKSNATKEGHTYWLFKGHGDDIVKLYDLTTLCSDVQENHNPFTVPVGMLLYRVARNMRQNHGRKKSGTIRTLLKNCLQLLDKDVHPQIVTSAQFLLSDLYVGDDFLSSDQSPDISDESDTEDENQQEAEGDPSPRDMGSDRDEETKAPVTTIDVQALRLPESFKKPDRSKQDLIQYPPVTGNNEERCQEALKHVTQGLSCLDKSTSKTANSKAKDIGEEKQATCNPDIPIPLHYSPIKAQKDTTNHDTFDLKTTNQIPTPPCDIDSANQVSVFSRTSLPEGSWHRRSKYLLLKKGTIANYCMAKKYLTLQKYGLAWKSARVALHSCCTQKHLSFNVDDNLLLGCILALLGDVHLMMARNTQGIVKQKCDFVNLSDEDSALLNSCRLVLQTSDYEWMEPFSVNVRENLERSCHSYQVALQEITSTSQTSEMHTDISKRLGNILNELGVHYMNAAAKKMSENAEEAASQSEVQELSAKSCEYFEQGIVQFSDLDDCLNIALLYSNLGRLRRLSAQHVRQDLESRQGNSDFSPQESQFFSKAQECYQKALELLVSRDRNPDVWDSVVWELGSTCFTMATLLQDHAPLATKAQEHVEREVIRLMEKALANCKIIPNSPRQVACVYRAATIHHRMASLYHNAFRNQVDDKKLRYLRTHAEDQYVSAVDLYQQAEAPCELLRVQLERVALCEYCLQKQTSPVAKLRTLHQALECLRGSRPSIDLLSGQVAPTGENSPQRDLDGLEQEAEKLLGIFISRLQSITLNMVKISNHKSKKMNQGSAACHKEMYTVVLKCRSGDSSLDIVTRCQELSRTLHAVDKLCSQIGGDVANPSETPTARQMHPDPGRGLPDPEATGETSDCLRSAGGVTACSQDYSDVVCHPQAKAKPGPDDSVGFEDSVGTVGSSELQ